VAGSFEQRHKTDGLLPFQRFQNRIHTIANGQVIRNNLDELLPGIAIENTLQGIHQIEQPHIVEQLVVALRFVFGRTRRAGIDLPPHAFLRVELSCRLFECLVFEQTPDEFLAGIRPFLFILCSFIDRQQHPGFDLEQRRRHDEKLTGHAQIQLLHGLDIDQILLRDHGDGNVVDIDLVLLDQVNEQIERPLEVLDTNLIGQFGLFSAVELVIHKRGYTSFGGG
jgi:hypothetical protein